MSSAASPQFQSSLEAGRAHFHAGRFLEAHEAWEAGWKATQGVEKQYLQVLVMWATAFHHARRGNETGARKLISRAIDRLDEPSGGAPPLDLESLRSALLASQRTLLSGGVDPAPWVPGT